jgi:hypothetical protein
MGWERRRNGRMYYYRRYRRDGKLVCEYFGDGERARAAAEEDKLARRAKVQDRDDRVALGAALAEWDVRLDLHVRALLHVNGYHEHRGQWRKKRTNHRATKNTAGRDTENAR